ncbi:hypothetical protein D1AOALGA4SA_11113 [Olavius algarvensis Delta 1 endosymbiont]|nr:hypothetical protein D1AOALGA4SA_11113 [Olavius algarvensis Delta 1 endosymbiont]
MGIRIADCGFIKGKHLILYYCFEPRAKRIEPSNIEFPASSIE